MRRYLALIIVLATLPAVCQIPLPGRKKSTAKAQREPYDSSETMGRLRSLDDKLLVLEADDTRIIRYQRTADTKFYKQGGDIKSSDLGPGDHLVVEYYDDEHGNYTAVEVTLLKKATDVERQAASRTVEFPADPPQAEDERPKLRRSDSPATPAAPAADAPPGKDAPPAKDPPAEVKPDAGVDTSKGIVTDPTVDQDPSRPRIKRGKPAPRPKTETAEETPPPVDTASAAAAAPRVEEPERPKADPVIEKARDAGGSFLEKLPNYICQEYIARFINTSHVVSWDPLDVVSAELIFEKGQERYRNISVNGKPFKKRMQDLSGAWSTGEFGTLLANLLKPGVAASFHFHGVSEIAGKTALVYDFSVDREHSRWTVQAESQMVFPAYKGTVWFEKSTSRVLRIEQQAVKMPDEFPFDKIETAADFDYVRFGDGQYLVPIHAEVLSCERGSNACAQNRIDFRNYHKFTGESSITFGNK